MHPCSLAAWAACAVLLTLVSPRVESATTPATPASSPHIVKQINRVNDDGSYTIGYEAADGTFKIETRDTDGNVKGMFGFLDASGHIKRVAYATNNITDIPHNYEDINNVPELKRSTPTSKRPSLLRPTIRTRSPSNLIKYRRPSIPDPENPDDNESPIFAMLLRRSRQGLPSRSDADELLRLQQQTDSSDVYGSSSPSYQVPEVPFRQHFLQGGRGRINNAVLNHHLRQLTPDQLYELQQYATTASTQNVPEPTYASRVPTTYAAPTTRSAMTPLLQYLTGSAASRDTYDPMYPTRYTYSQPSNYPQNYYYPPTQPSYYPSQAYSGYNGLTSARSYPFQNPNLPDELRQALIFRMLLAARLLGLESFISRYNQVEDPRNFDQYYEDPRLAFSQGRTSSLYQDPSRYYPTRSSPYYQQPSYQAAIAVARANHARQLAAYQQSLQDRQITTRPTYTTQDYTDDAAITELRRQFGDTSLSPRYQYVYRDAATSDDDYGTATPSSAPSVSSTTASTTSAGSITRTERPTPSYIQRVRSVQVLNPATASPRGSASTTVSPTTRRPLAA